MKYTFNFQLRIIQNLLKFPKIATNQVPFILTLPLFITPSRTITNIRANVIILRNVLHKGVIEYKKDYSLLSFLTVDDLPYIHAYWYLIVRCQVDVL